MLENQAKEKDNSKYVKYDESIDTRKQFNFLKKNNN